MNAAAALDRSKRQYREIENDCQYRIACQKPTVREGNIENQISSIALVGFARRSARRSVVVSRYVRP
jgi:hypothetical protein